MAPRAAARLESLGFDGVHEYKAGKLDWLAAGLPTEGENSRCPRAGEASRKDVVVCGLNDRLGDVRDCATATGLEAAVVVDEERIVVGLLRAKQLELYPNLAVAQAMRPGPSTFRPYVSTKEMADYMVEHSLDNAPITTSDGKLVGLLLKSDAVRLAADASSYTRKLITTDEVADT
ncbi:MAG TPA: CBS domain-containing protein [Candidatus Dormibacteraeota bacterium]|nr:CBS domain-containing protein [Candidatus Dormibacteraeota bacterium]